MDKRDLKKKIQNHFRVKPNKSILLKINNKTKVKITYMYGAKYSLQRVENNKEQLITALCDINKLVELIQKEKVNRFR